MVKNLILLFCLIIAGSSLVAGESILVKNHDFEKNLLDPNCGDPVETINGTICDWDVGGVQWRLYAMEDDENGPWASNNGTPPTTLCDFDVATVEQNLGVPIVAGITYTLSFDWIIEWATGAPEAIIAEFVNMDTDQVLATETFESFAGTKRPDSLWEDRASMDYVAGAAEAGAILGIRLGNEGDAWVAIDNVAVDFEGIPVGTITETDGSTDVSESAASSDTYVITLTSEPPPSGVKITVVSTDPDCLDSNPARQLDITPAGWCGVAGSSSVTFTQANWQTPQTITVQGRDDGVAEGGDHSVTMTHSVELVVPGEDPIGYPDYTAPVLTPSGVTVNIQDARDVTIAGHEALEVAEAGETSDGFTVVLTSAPSANVTVGLDFLSEVLNAQVTANDVTFSPGDWSTPKTITLTAIDDLVIEPAAKTWPAPLVITTTDVNYQAITLPDINFTVLDDDVRVCSTGDEFDLTSLLLSNPGFESPVVADGAWYTEPNSLVDFDSAALGDPVGRPESEARIRNYTALQFSDRYPAATLLPGGEQLLSFHGDMELVRNVPTATYLVEGGTISYKMSAKIGRPYVFSTQTGQYEVNTISTPVRIVLLAAEGNFQHPQTYEWVTGDIPNGDFTVVEFCWDVPADRAGEPMVIRVDGVDVDVDDLQISVACAHCDGYCYPGIGLAGGDLDDNCLVNLFDFAIMGGNWMRCDLWPQSDCLTAP